MAEDKSEWGVPQNAATVRAALLCREHTSPFQPAALSAACHYLAVHHGLPSSKKKKSDSFIYSTLLDFAAWPDKDMVIFLHFAAHEVPALSIEAKCSLHLRVEWKAPIPPCSMKQNTLRWYSIVPYPTRSFPGKPEHINSLTADPPMTDKPETSLFHWDISSFGIKSYAYLQLIPAGGGLFCPRCASWTQPLFQVMDTDCVTSWKENKSPNSGHLSYWTVTSLCWFKKTRPTSNRACALFILQRCYWTVPEKVLTWAAFTRAHLFII